MKYGLSLLLLLAVVLSACTALPGALAPTQTSAPTTIPGSDNAAVSSDGSNQDKSCGPGACVRQVFVQNDGEQFSVLFDIVGKGGKMDPENPPQFIGDLVFGSYYIKADGTEDFLVGGRFTMEQYFCYSGNDIPWNAGSFGAVCGFSVPLADMQTYQPQVGDQVRVTLPFYSNFSQTVTVDQGEPAQKAEQ